MLPYVTIFNRERKSLFNEHKAQQEALILSGSEGIIMMSDEAKSKEKEKKEKKKNLTIALASSRSPVKNPATIGENVYNIIGKDDRPSVEGVYPPRPPKDMLDSKYESRFSRNFTIGEPLFKDGGPISDAPPAHRGLMRDDSSEAGARRQVEMNRSSKHHTAGDLLEAASKVGKLHKDGDRCDYSRDKHDKYAGVGRPHSDVGELSNAGGVPISDLDGVLSPNGRSPLSYVGSCSFSKATISNVTSPGSGVSGTRGKRRSQYRDQVRSITKEMTQDVLSNLNRLDMILAKDKIQHKKERGEHRDVKKMRETDVITVCGVDPSIPDRAHGKDQSPTTGDRKRRGYVEKTKDHNNSRGNHHSPHKKSSQNRKSPHKIDQNHLGIEPFNDTDFKNLAALKDYSKEISRGKGGIGKGTSNNRMRDSMYRNKSKINNMTGYNLKEYEAEKQKVPAAGLAHHRYMSMDYPPEVDANWNPITNSPAPGVMEMPIMVGDGRHIITPHNNDTSNMSNNAEGDINVSAVRNQVHITHGKSEKTNVKAKPVGRGGRELRPQDAPGLLDWEGNEFVPRNTGTNTNTSIRSLLGLPVESAGVKSRENYKLKRESRHRDDVPNGSTVGSRSGARVKEHSDKDDRHTSDSRDNEHKRDRHRYEKHKDDRATRDQDVDVPKSDATNQRLPKSESQRIINAAASAALANRSRDGHRESRHDTQHRESRRHRDEEKDNRNTQQQQHEHLSNDQSANRMLSDMDHFGSFSERDVKNRTASTLRSVDVKNLAIYRNRKKIRDQLPLLCKKESDVIGAAAEMRMS